MYSVGHGGAVNSTQTRYQDAYKHFEETMNEDNGPAGWNNLQHVKCRLVHLPNALDYAVWIGGTPWWHWTTKLPTSVYFEGPTYGHWTAPTAGLPNMYTVVGERKDVNLPFDLSVFMQDSVSAMLPKIKPQLSLLNSIIELRDFKSLPRSVSSAHDKLRLLNQQVGPGIALMGSLIRRKNRTLASKTLSQLLRPLIRSSSDAYLQAQFNIGPLLSDLTGIYNAYKAVDKEINKLLANEGRVRLARYARPVTTSIADLVEQTAPAPLSGVSGATSSQRVTSIIAPPTFRAQMSYSYRFSSYQRTNAFSLGRMDSLGLGGVRPSILWNALPWSFVVDWFAGIGQWIKRNVDTGALDPVTNIHRYLWSYKAARRIILSTTLRATAGFLPVGPLVPIVMREEHVYIRRADVPDIYSSLRSSGLSSKEFSLAAALALSR